MNAKGKLSNNSLKQGSGCLTIFGLVFLIAGLGIGLFAMKNLFLNLKANSWHATQATILSAELKVNRGDDSDAYKAIGQYRYEYAGVSYESSQLFFGNMSDNIGSFHQDLVNNMQQHRSRQQSMTAWVNPDNPGEAVLVKKPRWGLFSLMMLFPLTFGGIGGGIIWGAKKAKKKSLEEANLRALYPEQAWLWRPEWHSPTLTSNNKNLLWFSVGFAVFWNLISTPLMFVIPGEVLEKQNYPALIGLLFPLVGIGLAAWAFRNYQKWKRFGESEFTIQDMPARLGSTLRGELLIPGEIPSGSQCLVRFECIHSYRQGSGEDSKTVEDILWQDEQRLNVSTGLYVNGHTLPIVFKVPINQPITDWMNGNNRYIWRLSVQSDIPGADYSAQFELPVFESLITVNDAEALYEDQFFADLNNDDASIDQGDWSRLDFGIEQTVAGTQYTFARARLKGMCMVLTFMTLIFGGVGIVMFNIKNGSILIGVVFSLFGLLLGWGAIHQWLYKSRLLVSYDRLEIQSGWFMTNSQQYKRDDIKRIYKHSSMSSGNIKYYGVFIDTPEKNKIKLAENLVGNRDVDSLIARISDELGLSKA